MSSAPPIADDARRLERLRELLVLDTAAEPLFDGLARLAAEVCDAPIALLSLVDKDRQWVKAHVGVEGVHEIPRNTSFCAHAIADDALFEVVDARLDPRFCDNPLVNGPPDIRFYAGAPLVLPGGERVGTLCVLDRAARRLNPHQQRALQSLAATACQAMEMRRDLINRSQEVRHEFEQALAEREAMHRAIVEDQSELVSLARPDGELVYVNPAYAHHFGRTPGQMVGESLFAFVDPADRSAVQGAIDHVMRTGESTSSENRMVTVDGSERWVAWTNRRQFDTRQQPMLHSVGRDVSERRQAESALRASQAFLERTGRVAGVGGWEQDIGTGTVTWSDEMRRIHEVAADFAPTLENALSFYAPEARSTIDAAARTGMQQGTPWDMELPLITAAGRHIWVRAVGDVEFDAGQPVRLVGALQDVTERKRLQQRLADNERFVHQITDSLPVRIAYVDKERRYRFVNLAHLRRFGRERDQILGRTRAELTDGTTDAVVEPHLKAVLDGEPQRFEYDEMVGGEPRRIESQLLPDVGEDGQVLGFFATGIDITERTAAERARRELTMIFDNTTDGVVQTDWRGSILYMNPAVRTALGLAPDAPVAHRNFGEFNTPATNQMFAETIVPAVREHGVWLGETTVLAAGGRVVPVSHMVIGHRGADGRIDRYSSVIRDISAELAAKHELQRQTAILRSVTEAIPSIVAVIGPDMRYRFVNGSFENWRGVPRRKIIGKTILEVLGPGDHDRSRHFAERALAGETVSFERDYPARGATRHLALTYIPLRREDGTVDGFVGVGQDITHHRQEALRLLQMTQRDALTGLLNRTGIEQDLQRRLHEGSGPTVALLAIDLDHFKPVNDRHGHPVGDKVLQLFAQRLRGLVRPTDAVARLGGDEFAVLLGGVKDSSNIRGVADKILAAAHAPFEVGELLISVGASIGVAFGADPVTGWGDMLTRADAMLYQAKDAGRGRQAGATR